MSVTRGKFLKELGRSLPGMMFGTGTTVAQKFLGKIAAVSAAPEGPAPVVKETSVTEKPTTRAFITSGPADGNQIALTFDDGPIPGVTEKILDELKSRKVHATFFMIGKCVAAAPELARRVLEEGHEIGNHSYSHPHLSKLPEAQVVNEIERTQEVFLRETNHRPRWFRPPYGSFRANQDPVIERVGMEVVLWNVDPGDWAESGEEKTLEIVIGQSKPGSIVVCHDRTQTGHCLGQMIEGLAARGLFPVTLSELLVSSR